MNVFTIEVAWGERLDLEIGRWEKESGMKRSQLFIAVGDAMGCTRNTIAKLTGFHEMPTTTQDLQRAYVLIAWIGRSPEAFGIDDEELPPRLLREVRELVEHKARWITVSPDQLTFADSQAA